MKSVLWILERKERDRKIKEKGGERREKIENVCVCVCGGYFKAFSKL